MKSLKTFLNRVVLTFGILFPMIATAAAPTWTRTNYTSSTAFIGIVKINDYNPSFPITVEEGDYIGAFVGEECRMIAKVFAYDGKLYVSSVIQGGDASDMTGSTSTPEEVEFKVWDNSANQLVSAQVYGTLFTESAGEIFDYEIGKPNTDSKLESLSVTDYTLDPAFSATTTEYEISVPYGTSLPSSSAYTAVAADSRANAAVVAATEFGSDNKATTTITVTAEDNTTTVYTITFVQEPCTAEAPTTEEVKNVSYCWGDEAQNLVAMFGNKSHNAVWYDVQTEGTPLFIGNSFKHGKTDVEMYTFYVARNDGTCESEGRLEVTLTINAIPSCAITGLKSSYCSNEDAVTLSAEVQPSEGVKIFMVNGETATQFDPATASIGKNTISCQYIDNNSCRTSDEIEVTVKALPTINLSSMPTTACVDESISLTPTKGTWSGIGVSGTTFSSETAGSVTLTYEESANGCSASDNVTITVNKATAPTVQSASVEMNAAVPALTATADGTINWYETESGTVKGTGSSFTPSVSTAEENVFTFYVSNTIAGCESEKVPVTLSVTSCTTEAPSIASVDAICEGDAFPTLTATGTNITWYSAVTGGTSLTTGATYTPTAAGTYYASQNPGCEGPRASVTVEVKEKPAAPTVTGASSCDGGELTAMTSNVAADWYTDKNASAVAENTTSYKPTSLNATTKFYVKQVVGGCSSDFGEATHTIASAPSKPKVDATETCLGSTAYYFVRMSGNLDNGATLQWYDENGTALGTERIQDVAVTKAGVYNYTAKQVIGECYSDAATATLTVYALPKPTITVNSSFCSDDETEVDVVVDTEGGDLMIDDIIMFSSSFVPKSLGVGSHRITYSYEDEHSCYGETEVLISVDDCAAPAVETISLGKTSLSLLKGQQADAISVTILPAESPQTVKWSSSNPNVVTVDTDGKITAVGKGTATITATSTYTSTKSASCEVTVVAPVESVAFNNPSDITVAENGTVSLSQFLVVNPDDASVQSTEWTSSSSVATVTNGVVSVFEVDANTEVTITVKVTTEDGTSKTAQITVTIINGCSLSAPAVKVATQTICSDGSEEAIFTATGDASADWVWVDGSNEVVSSINSFTTSKAGSYFVYQVDGDCKSPSTKVEVSTTECAVPVQAVSFTNTTNLTVGESTTIDLNTYLKIQPDNASVESIVWSSSSSAATVADGVVSAGEVNSDTPVTITANVTTKDGTSKTATVTVTIINGCSLSAPTVANSTQSVCAGSGEKVTFTASGTASASWVWENASNVVVSSTSSLQTATAGTYYVYQKEGSCESPRTSVSLVEKAKPAKPVVADVSVCEGESARPFSSNVVALWYTSANNKVAEGISYTPTSVGTYYVKQEVDGCLSDATTVTYTINKLPVVSITPLQPLTADDSPVTVTISPVGGTLSGTGVKGSKFDPSVGVGTYTLKYTYTDVNGCSNEAFVSVTVSQGVDRTQLGDTISRATTVSNMYLLSEEYPAAAKDALAQAIVTAQSYYNNYTSYSQSQINNQVTVLSNAIQMFLNSKVEIITLTALEAKIIEANTTLSTNEYRKGTDVGNIPESSFPMLRNAVSVATAIYNNQPTTQAEVDAAVANLDAAILAFLRSEIPNVVTDFSFVTKKIYMLVGEEYTPEMVFSPVGASTDLLWASSNTDVVDVYGSGKIVAKKAGSVAVTATCLNNAALMDRVVVIVTEAPVVESITTNKLGNQLYVQFSEKMSEPTPSVYVDLLVLGNTIPMYNVVDVSKWPLDEKRIVITLGTYVDDPNDIHVMYKGNSLTSVYGGAVQSFDYALGGTPVEDITESETKVYPTFASTAISVSGLREGNLITIVSAKGDCVSSLVASAEVESIQISHLVAGTYYIIVSDQGQIVARHSFVKK